MLPGFPIFANNRLGPRIIASRSFGQSNSTSGQRSVSVSYPSGTQDGDLVVAIATCAGNATPSFANPRSIRGPEGWAPVTSNGNARGVQITINNDIGWQTLMRVAQPGDTSFTFSAINSQRINVSLVTVRGAALPLDAVSHGAETAGGTLAALTAVSEMVTLLLLGGFSNSTSTEPIAIGPSSTTELLSYAQGTAHAGGSRNWAGYEYGISPGSTGSRVWAENGSSNILAMLSMAAGDPGDWLYDKAYPSSGSWVVPAGVTSVNILCVGSGGDGFPGFVDGAGGGGACAYSNDVAVTPGESLTVHVGESLDWTAHNTNDCASYVKRGSTTLVLADYGRPATPDPAVGAGGLASNCVGDTRIDGLSGDGSTNTGGGAATPYGILGAGSNSWGTGMFAGSDNLMTSGLSGTGAGAPQHSSSALKGVVGTVIITWGRNRSFGQGSGRFI